MQNYLPTCALSEWLRNSAQTHVSINLFYVVYVFKTQQKQPLIMMREEVKSKY